VIRTHEAGTLREEHAGTTVTLTGWVARRRDHGGVAFLDLRDGSGIAQVVVRENDIAHDLRAEYCVRVVGEVRVRPEGNRNDAIPTGAVEVAPARSRCCRPPRRCPSRSTTTSPSATRSG
jgi:aspartyl-tRNA synthetase